MTSSLPTYSKQQLDQYFDHIQLPSPHRIFDIHTPAISPEETLRYLALLQKLTLVTVPFENLSIHYSESHNVDIDPEALFDKIVGRGMREAQADKTTSTTRRRKGGRGGYCMENNCFFGTILRSLGFDIYSVGARVYGSGSYNGWSHMVNLVTIGMRKYQVDIGFGGGGPPHPMPLLDSNPATNSRTTAGAQVEYPYLSSPTTKSTAKIRTVHRLLDDPNCSPQVKSRSEVMARGEKVDSERSQLMWVYEVKHEEDGEWQPNYAFTETEFLPQDFEMMNFYTSKSPRIFFTFKIVMVRYLLEGDDGSCVGEDDHAKSGSGPNGSGELDWEGKLDKQLVEKKIVGQIILNGSVVKRRIGSKTETLEELKTEDDRCKALEKWFGIVLTSGERRGIRGMVTELSG